MEKTSQCALCDSTVDAKLGIYHWGFSVRQETTRSAEKIANIDRSLVRTHETNCSTTTTLT
jgi:hypothetical protein